MLKLGKMGEAQRKVRRANEYLKAGDLDNAALWFEEALALDPNNKKALAGLGKVARSKKIKDHLTEGSTFLEQGHLEEAEKELRQVISLEPKNADAIEGLRQIAQLRRAAMPVPEDKEVEKPPAAYQTQRGQEVEERETLAEYLRRNRLRARYLNLDALLLSAVIHIAVFLVLSIFVREIIRTPRDEISIQWVKVDDPRAPAHRPLKIVGKKEIAFDPRLPAERAVKSLAAQVSKSNLQSPMPDSIAKRIGVSAGQNTLSQVSSVVETPISNADMVFSPNEKQALGSSIVKPDASDRTGIAATGSGRGGLSSIKATTTFGDGVSGAALGGIGRIGLVGPDPLDMVSAITAGRQDNETVVFLLDVSNSMAGNYRRCVYNREWFKKLKRAKSSIVSSLHKLRTDEDKFFLVAFSSSFKLFHEEPVIANEANLKEAVKFVEGLRPTSHRERTNLYNALSTAMKVKPTRIILVSDGLPTEGVVSVRNILKGVKQRVKDTRIYTFATNLGGQEEARVLLSKLARDNSGRFVNDRMGLPRGIAVNSEGHVYVADKTVNVFDRESNYIRSFGSHTIKLAVDSSDDIHLLFFPSVRSSGFGAAGVCRADGTQLNSFSSHGYLPRQLYEPWDIAADSKGNTYVVSTRSNKISVFDKDGKFMRSFGSAGMKAYITNPHERGDSLTGGSRGGNIDRHGVNSSDPGYFSRPMGIALDSHDKIYVLDSGNRRIQIFDPHMQFMNKFKIDGYGIAIDVDAEGKYIYVLVGSGATGGEKLCIYRPNGGLVEEFDVGAGTADIDADPDGNIYALNFVYDEVNVFSSKGEKLRSFSTIH